MKTQAPFIDKAIKVLGGISATARALNIARYQTVQQWRINGIPASYAPTIERLTTDAGDKVRCEDLCPDVDWAYLRNSSLIDPNGKLSSQQNE